MLLNSFNASRTFGWPPSDLTLRWWSLAAHSQGAREALWVSIRVAFIAIVVSLLIILPIALPGIVTGLALDNVFTTVQLSPGLGFRSIVMAHATFCIVTVFNNVQARLRRMGGNSRMPRWTSVRGRSRPSGS